MVKNERIYIRRRRAPFRIESVSCAQTSIERSGKIVEGAREDRTIPRTAGDKRDLFYHFVRLKRLPQTRKLYLFE